ncbi:MAG TPA: hypothetical protein DEU93_08885 [Chitinophagaceae bacterium]|nr:hypothetical protein [Chitinophagaceae bacterium]
MVQWNPVHKKNYRTVGQPVLDLLVDWQLVTVATTKSPSTNATKNLFMISWLLYTKIKYDIITYE